MLTWKMPHENAFLDVRIPGNPCLSTHSNCDIAFLNHGQICFSTERIIVHRAIAEAFIAKLNEFTADFDAGSGAAKNIVSKAHMSLVDAQEKGANFLTGGPSFIKPSCLQPTLLTGITKDMMIYDEETFGPSAAVCIVNTDEEAIELANDSQYGLNAAIHTQNMFRGISIGRRLEVGQVHINSLTENDERMSITIFLDDLSTCMVIQSSVFKTLTVSLIYSNSSNRRHEKEWLGQEQ